MLKQLLACALAVLAFTSGLARADEADIRKAIAELFGTNINVDSVRKSGVLNFYEVQIGADLLYVDEKGAYIFQGDIYDIKRHINLTQSAKSRPLPKIKFSELPLDLAVKTVRGNGKRVFVTFEDPICSYCKKLAKEVSGMTNYTMYTFLYPIFPNSKDKANAIWCAADQSKSWTDWMLHDVAPAAANCTTPVDKVLALGQKLNVRGTPAIFYSNGERIPGFVPAAQLEQDLNRIASSK